MLRNAAKTTIRYLKPTQKKTSEVPPPEFIHVPHNYVLKNARNVKQNSKDIPPELNPTIEFYVLGCGGTGKPLQKEVAELMDKIARGEIAKPKFIVILGDNFYEHGVESETDPQFKTKFEDVYEDKKLTGICGIPCFLIPGNHDHDVQLATTDACDIDYFRILGQINYSRLENGKKSSKREEMFKSPELDLKELGAFNMASRYYSLLIKGEKKAEEKTESKSEEKTEKDLLMCFADTTTLAKDYLNYLKLAAENKEDPNNQISWLKKLAEDNPDAIKLLFSHHSRIAKDKRSSHSDAGDYLSAEDIAKLNALDIKGNYNDILNNIFYKLGLDFKANFSAHTHSLYYYNQIYNKMSGRADLCQVGAGGGGGDLEYRYDFSDRDMTYLKNHGFVKVSVDLTKGNDKDCLTFDYYTTQGLHLKFKSDSSTPIRDCENEAREVVLLRDTVIQACNKYLYNTPSSGSGFFNINKSHHGLYGMNRAQDMINFFNRYEPIDYQEALDFIVELMSVSRTSWVDEGSLETILKEGLKRKCGLDYDILIAGPRTKSPAPPETPSAQPSMLSSAATVVTESLGSLASLSTNVVTNYFNPPSPTG